MKNSRDKYTTYLRRCRDSTYRGTILAELLRYFAKFSHLKSASTLSFASHASSQLRLA